MEATVSLAVGVLAGCGIFLLLRSSSFSALLGLTLLSYAVNALIFFGGRLGAQSPPIAGSGAGRLADPLPQALVLTAIVIGFGMTAYLVAAALNAKAETDTDDVDGEDRT